MSFDPGEQVGPYRIMEQLGQGGMATVYKAYHASLDRYVAIKVLHQAFLDDPNFQARFQREARVVAKLEHPNIVPIHDYAEHEKRPYLVMKFIEGETLKARLQSGPLPPNEVERIVDAVGAGLQYAHKEGILHRDIKPSNVMLAKDGRIYLADFGLARIAQSGESTLTSDMVIGTPQYISPEQAMAKKDLDEGTDIYSFGVMIYEMVVGCVPFSADTPFSVIHDHIYTPLPLPSKINPNVSPEVERVLLKALAKDRPDRYPDVASMVRAFKEAWKKQNERTISISKKKSEAETVATTAPAVTPTPAAVPAGPMLATEIQKPKRRSRWAWITVGLVTLLCLFSVIVLRGRLLRMLPGLATPTSQPTSTVVLSTATKPPIYPPGVLLQANFNDGQMLADWNNEFNWVPWDAQSNWSVQDGALCGKGHVFVGATKGVGWKDYAAKFRLRLDSGSVHLSLRQRMALGQGLDRYFFNVEPNGFNLSKQNDGLFKNNLAGLSVPFPLKQWTDIELVAQGNRVVMLVNGIIVIDFTDGDSPHNTGTFTLETLESSAACVDDIVVTDLTRKPSFDLIYNKSHFDSAQSLKGWNIYDAQGNPDSAWQAIGGALCGRGHNWATLNDMPLTDFTMKYRLFLKDGAIHLNFRLGDRSRYYTWISIGNQTVKLSKDTPDKTGSLLTSGRARLLPDQWYDLTFSFIGGRIQFWLNGERVYDFTDKAPLQGGLIGFESLDTQFVCIDDIVVTLPSLAQTP